jgi:hypothetical protein
MELETAIEGTTYVLTITVTDENGASCVPSTAKWSLRDNNGTIINGRNDVSLTPGASMIIILTSADLICTESSISRSLTIEATYPSAFGGTGTSCEEFTIPIRNLVGVP